jgi:hypothetical protein
VSPGLVGFMCRPIGGSAWASSVARADNASQKEPAIGDGSQSREKTPRHSKSIRGSVMCRNSHMPEGNAFAAAMSPGFAGCQMQQLAPTSPQP